MAPACRRKGARMQPTYGSGINSPRIRALDNHSRMLNVHRRLRPVHDRNSAFGDVNANTGLLIYRIKCTCNSCIKYIERITHAYKALQNTASLHKYSIQLMRRKTQINVKITKKKLLLYSEAIFRAPEFIRLIKISIASASINIPGNT